MTMKKIVLTGLLAAMVAVATGFLPFNIVGGGYIHLGDTVIYLAAALLPTPYAMAAAAIGAGVADLLVAPMWAPFTIVIKVLMVLAFTAKKERFLCGRNALATVIAGMVCVAGYFGAEVLILCLSGSGVGAAVGAGLLSAPFNGIQALASAVCFLVLAAALDRLQLKQRLQKM